MEYFFEIDSPLFKRTIGESAVEAMSKAELEAHQASLSKDEQNNYIQESIFGKEIATYFEIGLRTLGHNVKDNFAEDDGRVITIENVDGKRVQVAFSNSDQEVVQGNGTQHMFNLSPLPSMKARLFNDQQLSALTATIAADLEKLIDDEPEMTLIKKEPQ